MEYGDLFAFFERVQKGAQLLVKIYDPLGHVINMKTPGCRGIAKSRCFHFTVAQ
jgi:hypothetical protein